VFRGKIKEKSSNLTSKIYKSSKRLYDRKDRFPQTKRLEFSSNEYLPLPQIISLWLIDFITFNPTDKVTPMVHSVRESFIKVLPYNLSPIKSGWKSINMLQVPPDYKEHLNSFPSTFLNPYPFSPKSL
jgi:hypothetical protein